MKEKFLELHEAAQKWEILNYHLKVICTDNQEHISPPALETDAHLMREEAYLAISTVNKLFRHFWFYYQTESRLQLIPGVYLYHV